MKRICIYSLYDKNCVVDRYITFFLNQLKESASYVLVVCNEGFSKDDMEEISAIANELISCNDSGYDFWGYKQAIDYLGIEKLKEYDEVLLVNTSLMGPIYTFDYMFKEMSNRKLDFWGITRVYKYNYNLYNSNTIPYVPEHIHSGFIAFEKRLVQSNDFKEYWRSLTLFLNDNEEKEQESVITKWFADKGYLWDTYVYTDDIKEYNAYPLLTYPKMLIEDKGCPVFLRDSFFQPYNKVLQNTMGQPAKELYDYLKEKSSYDTDMIWEYLLRTKNQADIFKNMQLNYICSSVSYTKDIENKIKKIRIALFIHIYYEDMVDSVFRYTKSIPDIADIYISTDTEKKKSNIIRVFSELTNNIEVNIIPNRGRDVSSILIGFKDKVMNYDVACFVHDKKTSYCIPGSIGESFAYKCFENTLHNEVYVNNVINLFIENSCLGLLSPPPPNHADFFPTLGLEWGKNYKNTKDVADELQIMVPMSEDKEPIAPLGTFFWFRPKAFVYLYKKEWKYEDFPEEPNQSDGTLLHAIERVYAFAVQQAGYYPAYVQVDKQAEIEMNNLRYYVREYNKVMVSNNILGYQSDMVNLANKIIKNTKENSIIVQYENLLRVHQAVCQEWNKEAEELRNLRSSHEFVCGEWKKTADELIELKENYEIVCGEWSKTREVLNELQERHSFVCEEWKKTADELKELRINHEFACREWKKTADELKELRINHEFVCKEWKKTADELVKKRKRFKLW